MQSPCLVAMYVYFLHANIRAQGLSYISSDGNHSSESQDRQDVGPESVGGVDGLGDDAGRGDLEDDTGDCEYEPAHEEPEAIVGPHGT